MQRFEVIEGTLMKVISNYNNYYKILIYTNEDQHKTIYGTPDIFLRENSYYRFEVYEEFDKLYGRQIKFNSVEQAFPSERKNILKILQSNIKGVGLKSAETIYDTLGEDTLKDLSKDPMLIYSVKVSVKIQDSICSHFREMSVMNKQMLELQEIGLSYSEAYDYLSQVKEEGEEDLAVDNVRMNPYLLRFYIKKIGFIKCDYIAQKIGFPRNHPIRIEECIYYLLNEADNSGHVCLPKNALLRQLKLYLGITVSELKNIISDFEMTKEVQYSYFENEEKKTTYVYLKRNDIMESKIAYTLNQFNQMKKPMNAFDIEKEIDIFENELKSKSPNFHSLHENQRLAIVMALSNNLAILSGGPGTGKTTILNFIIHIAKKYQLTFKLAAPTGMASKKMMNATQHIARTLHRTLEYDLTGGKIEFLRNENNPIDADFVVIDESSMIDMQLFYYTLRAISPNTRVLIVGDPDQLASVGSGNILEDMINSKMFPHVHLSKIYRQGDNSMIVENAHRINNKQPLLLQAEEGYKEDFHFIHMTDKEQVRNYIRELIEFRLKDRLGYNPMQDIQILLPRKKGPIGVLEYNPVLQNALNPKMPSKKELVFQDNIFRFGDKVMQLTNNQEKDVFNGDLGYITYIEANSLQVKFQDASGEDKFVNYDLTELEELQLAYSCTIHKSQGSEYPVVIIPVIAEDYMMITKKLMYTAVTRGKALVILVGDYEVFMNNIYVREEEKRITNLTYRLLNVA